MGQRINKFCEDLRLKLTKIDSGFEALDAKVQAKSENADKAIRARLEEVQRGIDADRAKRAAAQAKIDGWVAKRKAATAEKIAQWKTGRELTKLQNRADDAEEYAAAALDIALAAVDEAEQAALEAWLARHDADSAQARKAATPASPVH